MVAVQTVLVLVILAIALGLLSRRIGIPYPIALVLGGLALGFIHQLPDLELDPDFVFFFFLPPLLYHAAVFTSWRDFRASLSSISLLAVGLVIATTIAVGAVAHYLIPQMPWAAALALGAIVSPPDAVAAVAAMRNSKIPRTLITIIEGESLVNDASGLVIYKYAVAAVVAGTFSAWNVAADFVFVGPGGVAVGLVLGYVFLWIHRRLSDPMIEVTMSLAVPFAVYIVAERLGTSGVLAVVTAGLIRGWYMPEVLAPHTRIRSVAAWDVTVYVLTSLVFIMIGSELDEVVAALPGYSLTDLFGYSAAVALAAIAVRFLWVFSAGVIRRIAQPRRPHMSWRELTVLGWAGMRGVVSLAAALALPYSTAAGQRFPGRELIAFLTFAVIFATLVVQGMTIAPLARLLGVEADDVSEREERLARSRTAHAALDEVGRWSLAGETPSDVLDSVRAEIGRRIEDVAALENATGGTPDNVAAIARRNLMLAALGAQRRELLRLRRDQEIGDDVLHRIERELDLQEEMLE